MPRLLQAVAWACAVALAGCSQGGDSSGSDPLAPQAQVDLKDAATIFGVDQAILDAGGGGDGGGSAGAAGAAGDGAPWRRAIVVLTDRAGQAVIGLTDDNGRFLLKFDPARFNPPYVLQAVDQAGKVLSSVVTDTVPTGKASWANINPLTDKVVSGALASDVAGTDKLFTGAKVSTDSVTAGNKAVVDSVRSALGSVLPAGVGAFDPIRSRYGYDGQGVDAIIDSVSHVRLPDTGATELRPKLAKLTNNTTGTEVAVPVTTASPLPADQVLASNAQAFTAAKLQSWIDEINRCLALTAVAAAADAACADADGSRLVSGQYRAVGKDFREHLRTLYSEADGSAVSGSVVRRGVLLFVERSAGSGVDDLAAVELLIRQPHIGPRGPDGAVTGAVEYPLIVKFRRDDTLTRAVAGNWILFGDQLAYNIAVYPRYGYFVETNPAVSQTGVISSSVQFSVATKRWNAGTQTYVDANLRAVRITGPALPSAGLVMSPNNVCGASAFLTISDKAGQLPASGSVNGGAVVDYRLAFATSSGAPLAIAANDPTPYLHAPQLTDFSGLRAYSQYTFEIFLNSNSSNVADLTQTVRMFASVLPPQALLGLPVNNPIPSLPLVTAPAPAVPPGGSITVNWIINPLAAPVSSAFVSAGAGTQVVAVLSSPVRGASSLGNLPSSQLITVPTTSADPNCAAGLPALQSGGPTSRREVNIRSLQAWSIVVFNGSWDNP